MVDGEFQGHPAGTPIPLGPLHSPIQPIRRAGNTVATGVRCARCSLLPYTMCSVHYRYYTQHGFLPPVGARTLGAPRPLDIWRPNYPQSGE